MSTFVQSLQVDRKEEGGYAGTAILGVIAKSPFPPYTETTQFSPLMQFDDLVGEHFKTILGVQVTDLMETNDLLNKELVAVVLDKDQAEQALNKLEQDVADLREDITARNEQLQDMQSALSGASTQIVEMTKMRNAAEAELQSAMTAATAAEEAYRKSVAAVEQQLQEALASRQSAMALLTASQTSETELRSQNAQLRLENARLGGSLHIKAESPAGISQQYGAA